MGRKSSSVSNKPTISAYKTPRYFHRRPLTILSTPTLNDEPLVHHSLFLPLPSFFPNKHSHLRLPIMLVETALYWLFGMPVVAVVISSACQEIHMSKNDSSQFWLEGTGCHEPGSNDNYLGKIDLGMCIGMNPDTSKLEWKRL